MDEKDIKSLLHISSQTWLKDSNGLFDYESKQTKNLKAFLGQSVSITRKGYDLNSVKNTSKENNEEKLFNIIKSPDSIYTIENPIQTNEEPNEKNVINLNNKIWYIINQEQMIISQSNNHFHNINRDYYISKNDIIKLGRVKYIISEVNILDEQGENNKNNLNIPSISHNYINEINAKSDSSFELIYKAKCLNEECNMNIENNNNNEEKEKQLCKICYSEETDNIDNPMVHLCKCKGGLNYAHFECIKKWMKTKLMIVENTKKTVKSYYIQCFNCEICKTPYPFRFKINNNNNDKIYELIEIERPTKNNYIMLESLNQIKDNCNIKSIHVISLINNDDIFIGRGHDCDVKVKDISVSRYHSKIKYNINDNSILIKDLKSKFGTLVLIRNSFEIKEPIQIQVGRTYIKASTLNLEQQKKQIENEQKNTKNLNLEQKSGEKEEIHNNINNINNKYEPIETEYKENESEKKIDENNNNNNNNMEIEEN